LQSLRKALRTHNPNPEEENDPVPPRSLEIVNVVTLQINVARTWKFETLAQRSRSVSEVDTWVYYCTLCDEVLLVARRFIDPKGIQAAYDGVCPDCGFGLEDVMNCENTRLSNVRATYVNPKYPKAALLVEHPPRAFEGIRPRGSHLPAGEQVLTTGIERLDRLVQLATGQFVVFQGLSPSISLAELLCVRAQLGNPAGLESNAIFIDGGNSFDVYATSNYAIEYGIEPNLALSRIHISRAFTYFQLASLLTEKLLSALTHYNAKFAIVSDVTGLFQDPEIKDKQEAYRVFQRMLRSLSAIAEITGSLVVVTSFRQNIKSLDAALVQTAHATILAEERDTSMRFILVRHRSLPFRTTLHREACVNQFLEDFIEAGGRGEPSRPGGSSSTKNSQN